MYTIIESKVALRGDPADGQQRLLVNVPSLTQSPSFCGDPDSIGVAAVNAERSDGRSCRSHTPNYHKVSFSHKDSLVPLGSAGATQVPLWARPGGNPSQGLPQTTKQAIRHALRYGTVRTVAYLIRNYVLLCE